MNIVICGAGEVGRHSAEILGSEGHNITIIDPSASKLYALEDGEVWRVLTWIDGATFDRVANRRQAQAAGGLLARFHSALADLDHEFQSLRVGVHDTPAAFGGASLQCRQVLCGGALELLDDVGGDRLVAGRALTLFDRRVR